MTGAEELGELARDIAQEAADRAARLRQEGVRIAATKSTRTDIVTNADRETERLIRDLLSQRRPDDAFFGEESAAASGTSGLTWIVDPIDGTVNYAYGIPAWAVSIAVVEGEAVPGSWRALAGAVVNPSSREVYTATRGGGAFLNGQRIRVSGETDLALALVGTGFSYTAKERVRAARVLTGLIGRVRDIRRAGAASLDLCAVAAGRLDAYYERGLQPWDHAAGALIACEAGARVGGLEGEPEGADLTMAAGPALYAQLESLLTSLRDEA